MGYDISKIIESISGLFVQKPTVYKRTTQVKLISDPTKLVAKSEPKPVKMNIDNTPYIDLGFPIRPEQIVNERKGKAIGVFSFPDGTLEKPKLHNEGGLV